MTIEQGYIGELGIRRYVGPLVVWIQELDGTFKHTLQIEHQVVATPSCLLYFHKTCALFLENGNQNLLEIIKNFTFHTMFYTGSYTNEILQKFLLMNKVLNGIMHDICL